jgi:hypothetical protein
MTIRKGEAWGTIGPVPAGAVRVHSDAELHRNVHAARTRSTTMPVFVLLGGSLMRAVGGSGDAARLAGEVALLPVDLVRVGLDDTTTWAVAHVIARRSRRWWLRGPIVAAMNAEFIGDWDVTPRGHPNDGRIDLLEVSAAMSVRDRWRAMKRLPSGTHLPHPEISVQRTATAERTFERPMRVWVDDVVMGETRTLRLTVEPDALVVCV